MSVARSPGLAAHIVTLLRLREPELRQAGIRRLSVFGSVARGEAGPDSDVDLAVEFDPDARIDMVQMIALERSVSEAIGRPVELLPEPIENPRLRSNVERDRLVAF